MTNQQPTALTWKAFAIFLIGIVLAGIMGYRHGSVSCQNESSTAIIQKQKKVNEIHTDVYSGIPNNRNDIIKWMHDKVR